MELIRHRCLFHPGSHERFQSPGPCPGGYFWAAATAHDLPLPRRADWVLLRADLDTLLQIGCRVWVADVQGLTRWELVASANLLPQYFTEGEDDYDACRSYSRYRPYLPEFYIVPPSPMPGWGASVNEWRQFRQEETAG